MHFSPLELATESIQLVLIICTSLNSNKVWLMKSTASEPGLKLPFCLEKINDNVRSWLLMYLIEEDRLPFELVLVAPWSSNWYKVYGDSLILKELSTVEGIGVDRLQLGQDQASSPVVKRDSVQPSHLSSLKKIYKKKGGKKIRKKDITRYIYLSIGWRGIQK